MASIASGFILVTSLLFFGCDQFLNTVLGSFTRHSIFVSVPVRIGGHNEIAVIENGALFAYFRRQGVNDRPSYRDKVIQIITTGKQIEISLSERDEFGFKVVSVSAAMQKDIGAGRARFLETYLQNGVIKKDLSSEEKYAVISQLFKWKIASVFDDETGVLFTFDPSGDIPELN